MFIEVKNANFLAFSLKKWDMRAYTWIPFSKQTYIVATAASPKGMILYNFILRLHPSKTLLENLKSLNCYQDLVLYPSNMLSLVSLIII